MFSINTIQEILASLKHNMLRTVLTGLSVSWGIFILIILLAAGNGLQNGVTSNFSERSVNTVQMWSGTSSVPYKGLMSGRKLDFSDKQLRDIDDQVPEKGVQTALIDKQLNISFGSEYGSYSIKGVNADYPKIFNVKVTQGDGRFINQLDVKNISKVTVIDKKIADVLFKKQSALGKYVKIGDVMFKVIGINSHKERYGTGTAYIPYSTAQYIYNPNQKFYTMAMTVNGLEDEKANTDFNDRLTNVMAKSLTFDPKDEQALYLRNSQRNYLQTMMVFNGISIFVTIIGILTLIAGIVGVSNIMLVSVKERTREIGIRKAIGAPPAKILGSVVTESIMITGFFGYVGMMMGIFLTEGINYMMTMSAAGGGDDGMSVFKNPTVDLKIVLASTLVLIVAGIFAGYMPARRAVRIKPIEAMREE
jgi:putative ABC transport system permease protein